MPTVTVYPLGQRVKIPVKQRQVLWYDKYGQGTLQWLCRTTAQRTMSVRDIARQLGITFGAISAFYCHYVKPHIPEAIRVRAFVKPSKPKRLSLPIRLVPLARRAARRGLKVEPIANKHGEASCRNVAINDYICRVRSVSPNHPGGYAWFPLMADQLEGQDFVITIIRQVDKHPVYYVIPVRELKRLLSDRTKLTVYIPTRSHEVRRPKLTAWDRYRSAWHLLESR